MRLSETIRNNDMLSTGRSGCDLPPLFHGDKDERRDDRVGNVSPAAGRCLSDHAAVELPNFVLGDVVGGCCWTGRLVRWALGFTWCKYG